MKTNIKGLVIILLSGLITCSGTAFEPTINSDSAPKAGVISFSDITVSSVTATWTSANDDVTLKSSLLYKLVKADSPESINTISKVDAVTGDNLIIDWTAGTTSATASDLLLFTTYSFAVLVKDEMGGMSLYAPQSVSTANITGVLDESFSADGKVTTPVIAGSEDVANAVAIQADGKIVTAGYSMDNIGGTTDFIIVRYNTDGALDKTFVGDSGTGDGIVTAKPGGSTDNRANAVAIQSDGKILAAGQSDNNFVLVRYNTDGTLDTTFVGDYVGSGIVLTSIGTDDKPYAMALQSNDKIVVAGYSFNGTDNDFAIVRYNANGTRDTTFGGGDGIVTTGINSGNIDEAYAVAIQSDGKIVAAGSNRIGVADTHLAIIRYNANGSLDTSFGGGDGIAVKPDAGWAETANALILQPDGKIVTAGLGGINRYNTDGTHDTSFNWDGNIYIGFMAKALALQTNGMIVAAGTTGSNFALERITTDGIPDENFGTSGIVTIDINGAVDAAYAVAIQPDHMIVAAGHAGEGPNGDIAVIRLK